MKVFVISAISFDFTLYWLYRNISNFGNLLYS